MPSHVKLIFQATTGGLNIGVNSPGRAGSWTEACWHESMDPEQVYLDITGGNNPANGLGTRRAALMPAFIYIVGCRIQPYNIVGPELVPAAGVTLKRPFWTGNFQWPNDTPTLTVSVNLGLATRGGNHLMRLAGAPDALCVGGEIRPANVPGWFNAFDLWRRKMTTAFGTVVIDRNTPQKIATITDAGQVTTLALLTPPVLGSAVKVKFAMDACGRRRGGSYTVTAVAPDGSWFTIAPWQWGDCKGGTFQLHSQSYVAFGGEATWDESVVRKVGAPFARFVGRRRRRRA